MITTRTSDASEIAQTVTTIAGKEFTIRLTPLALRFNGEPVPSIIDTSGDILVSGLGGRHDVLDRIVGAIEKAWSIELGKKKRFSKSRRRFLA